MTGIANLLAAISRFFSDDDIGRIVGMMVWLTLCAILIPCLWRCIAKRPRYLDPLFSAALILMVNRVAFGVQAFVKNDALADVCRWTAVFGGIFFGMVVLNYKRCDHV